MQFWIIGITCLSMLGNLFPLAETSPLGSSFGSLSSFRPNDAQQAGFGEGIRDWYRNIKNRIFGGWNDQQVMPPEEAKKMMMELENEDVEDRKRYPGGFFLDLSNLRFDPETDWGFHLGQWYFIKKPYGTNDWKFQQPTYPNWPIIEEDDNDNTVFSLITPRPSHDVTTSGTSVPDEETSKVPETKISEGRDKENETHDSKEVDRSTEVLLPSE